MYINFEVMLLFAMCIPIRPSCLTVSHLLYSFGRFIFFMP